MTATFHVGDAITVMNTLPAKSVDLVLTSPPFLALRSYLPANHPNKALEGGSQATPGAYIDWLVDVVEACARVLAPHGSLCIELGDTYAGSGGAGGDYVENGLREGQPVFKQSHPRGSGDGHDRHDPNRPSSQSQAGLLPKSAGTGWPLAKSLSLIPELFRLTLVYGQNPLTGRQTERWRLRNVIRWVRPNPPVGALGDKFRPATSELMVFCKSAKRFFDLDAVREPHKYPETVEKGVSGVKKPAEHHPPPLDWWNIPPGGYEGAHYAVWPPELCVKPIKAMSPEKVCRVCGEPSRRIVEKTPEYFAFRASQNERYANNDRSLVGYREAANSPGGWDNMTGGMDASYVTTGFSDCGHNNWRPGLILDPFAGSGTTLAVATGHGRDAIGIDLDARNYQLALQRVGPLILQRGEVAA